MDRKKEKNRTKADHWFAGKWKAEKGINRGLGEKGKAEGQTQHNNPSFLHFVILFCSHFYTGVREAISGYHIISSFITASNNKIS